MTGEYDDALTAADELYRATTELIESEESNLHVIGVVAETYLSARGQPDLAKAEKDVRVAIEAADELAGWLQDMVECNPSRRQRSRGRASSECWAHGCTTSTSGLRRLTPSARADAHSAPIRV
jgi:hypothetical protein